MARLAYILAGEPSGDKIAASLMRSQKAAYEFHGIGGPLMAHEGLKSHHDYSQLQIVGLGDAIRHYSALKKLLNHLVDEVSRLRPEVIYTVDAKGFSLRFARAVKKRMRQEGWHAQLIHLVAPTIWAYGKGRAKAFEEAFDAMLCLFPMEKGCFDETALKTAYIGHPAAYHAQKDREVPHGTPQKCLILPGSRKSEITSLLPIFLEAAKDLQSRLDVRFTLVTIEAQRALISDMIRQSGVSVSLLTGQEALDEGFATHHIMLGASGTVTLEAALAGIPGIVAYRLNPLVAFLMKRRFYQSDPVLPNIILQEEVYPFAFQREVNAAHLADLLHEMIRDNDREGRLARQSLELRARLTNGASDFEGAIKAALDEILVH